MRTRRSLLVCLLSCLVIGAPLLAQEGHPLKGSWLGDWGPNRTQRTQAFIILDWDGKNITGTINPGPDAIPIQKATLELQQPAPPPGTPAQTAPARGGTAPTQGAPGGRGGGGQAGGAAVGQGGQQGGRGGGAQAPPPPLANWLVHLEADAKDRTHIVIDGKIENLGLYNRSLVGTWTQGNVKGDFKLTRQ